MDFQHQMAKFSSVSHNSSSVWKQNMEQPDSRLQYQMLSPLVVAPLTREVYTDYKLEKELAHLFPDFYYQFLENLSRGVFFACNLLQSWLSRA